MMKLPGYPLDSKETIRAYCRYSLTLYLNIETSLKELHGQNPPSWLVEETFKGALRPLVYVADDLLEKPEVQENKKSVTSEISQVQEQEKIKTPSSWLDAMSRKFNLDISNPKRIRMKTRLENGTYADLLSKMTQHGYVMDDHDFVLPEGKYE